MADDEQFSLCWNNFNSNLSAGFHESLQRGDLVDVTLAAEGQLVQAHRLVLSVCSPYFRKMFNQMPKNQHAFVFLKDVTHSALQDLIQFMYCGEVNVKQDALPAFISTAEALQIKGLTETGDSAPAQQSPVKEDPPAVPVATASISTTVPVTPQRTKVQRNRIQSYKLESEESGDDKIVHLQASTSHHVTAQQLQAQTSASSQKRAMPQRGVQSHASKRTKMSISASSDGLDTSDTVTTPTQAQTIQTVQIVKQLPAQVIEPEYIELPMESVNPKAEPDYTDEAAEIETVDAETEQEHKLSEHEQGDADDDGNYVEDETYGDMGMGKYEESYLTEGEEGAKPGVSGFVDSYTSDGGTGTEQSTQVCEEKRISKSAANSDCSDTDETVAVFAKTMRGKEQLIYMGQPFVFEKLVLTHGSESKKIWRCNQWWNQRCRARVYTIDRQVTPLNRYHTHVDIVKRKQRVVRRERSGTGGCASTPAASKSANTAVHVQQPQQQLPPSSTAAAPITKPTEHQTTLGGSGSSNKPRLPRLVDGVRHKIYDQVPLHAGSSVYIATKGLLSIYTSKPAVYTGRLVELMFGVETLKRSCLNGSEQTDPGLVPLDPTILDAVITHIVDVFQQQRQHITTGMVRNFIRNRMELLRTNAAIGGGGYLSSKKLSKHAPPNSKA
ncbi:modifier of mdg4-like isoform X2 [Anopheles stephensi]|uniref:modifier of mdg4-like isoform X2 n=1 Tax=Anopheles stephensi TaxID=30069 RepID=UPI0016588B11|nr:modifier of mdg4-like isoform X2 [Anopheles stephensi]